MGSYCTDLISILNEFRKNGEHCDVTLVSEDGKCIPAHKCILAAASRFLNDQLLSPELQDTCTIKLGMSGDCLEGLIEIIYSGSLDGTSLSSEFLSGVIQDLQLEPLSKLCKVDIDLSKSTIITTAEPSTLVPQLIPILPKGRQSRTPQKKVSSETKYKPPSQVTAGVRTRSKAALEMTISDKTIESIARPDIDIQDDIKEAEGKIQTLLEAKKANDIDYQVEDPLDDVDLVFEANGHVSDEEVQATLTCILQQMKTNQEEEFQRSVQRSLAEITAKISSSKHADAKSAEDVIIPITNLPENVRNEWKCCKYCSQFKGVKKGRLDFHVKFCHSKLKCDTCFKPFLRKTDLIKHSRCHSQQQSICELCGKTLVGPAALRLHMKIHLDTRKHQCQFCCKKFIRKLHLDAHVRHIHTKERPFKCSQCHSSYSMRYELTRHLQKHNHTTNYQCDNCGKSFMEKVNLTAHVKQCQEPVAQPNSNNATRKLFLCNNCGKVFIEHGQLIRHECLQQSETMQILYVIQQEQEKIDTMEQAAGPSLIAQEISVQTIQECPAVVPVSMTDQTI